MKTDEQRTGTAPRRSSFGDLIELGTWTTVPIAGRYFGIGRSMAYLMAQRGEFPVPVQRLGNRDVVLVADLARALGLDPALLLAPTAKESA